jgi:hypothetical protein
MLKKIVLVGLAILIPLGVANATRWHHRGDQPELQTQQPPQRLVCLTDKNCWCNWDDDWGGEGAACACFYPGFSGRDLKGRGVPVSKLVVSSINCGRLPKSSSEPLPPGGTGKFLKQMKP